MKAEFPAWALRTAQPEDREAARAAQRRETMHIAWPEMVALRRWAGAHGWPAPAVGFEAAFLDEMLKTDENFALAIGGSGITLRIPKAEHTLSPKQLAHLDSLYTERQPNGVVITWGLLTEELREVRRAVEAGVVVTVEGSGTLRTWEEFYTWAHGRYHKLEDGCNEWIGNDDP